MNKRTEANLMVGANNDKWYEDIMEENFAERKLVINNEITKNDIEDICLWLLKWEKEDKGKDISSRQRITLFLASYGGIVSTGYNIIDIMESMKTPVDCVVLDMAYSMAGLILLAGDKKIAFKNSTILLHDGSSGGYGSTSKMRDIAKFTEKQEKRIKDFVLENTNIEEELYDEKYGSEWYMYADEAKERGLITHIIGEDISLGDIL